MPRPKNVQGSTISCGNAAGLRDSSTGARTPSSTSAAGAFQSFVKLHSVHVLDDCMQNVKALNILLATMFNSLGQTWFWSSPNPKLSEAPGP